MGKKTCPSNGEAPIIFGGGQCSVEVKCEVIEKMKIEGIITVESEDNHRLAMLSGAARILTSAFH